MLLVLAECQTESKPKTVSWEALSANSSRWIEEEMQGVFQETSANLISILLQVARRLKAVQF